MMASDRPGDRVSLTRLLWIGPLTIGAAVLANVLFVMVVPPVLGVAPDFPALTKEAVGMFTAVGVFLAVAVFCHSGTIRTAAHLALPQDRPRSIGSVVHPGSGAACFAAPCLSRSGKHCC